MIVEQIKKAVMEVLEKELRYAIAVEDSNLALYCLAVEANYRYVTDPENAVLLCLAGLSQIERRRPGVSTIGAEP
jgi:hypothetical protein